MSWISAVVPPLGAFHLISWGTLLGTELYQSFVMTKLCFVHLPRPQFVQLQSHVFPIYFSIQTGLVLVAAATFPPYSLPSLFKAGGRWSAQVPMALNLAMALLNMFVYGPRTRSIMLQRTTMGMGEEHGQRGALDDRMKLNRDFSRNHAMSIHLNFIAMIATVWYGLSLASKLKFEP